MTEYLMGNLTHDAAINASISESLRANLTANQSFLSAPVRAINETLNATMGSIANYSGNSSLVMVIETFNRIDPLSIIFNLVVIIIILAGTVILANIADRMLKEYFLRIADRMLRGRLLKADTAMQTAMDKTTHLLIRRLVVATIYVLGISLIILQIEPLQRVAVAMLAGAGLAGLAIGFAAKDTLANVISGVSIVLFQPFRVGDYVTFNDTYGHIEDLTLRHTIICTWDKQRIVVPNSTMSTEPIVNWSIKDPISAWPVDFGIGYSSDIDKAREIILEEARKHPMVLKDRDITVRVTDLGDFAVNMRLLFNVSGRNVAYETGCDIRESVKKRFDAEGIEIPYPYRNVILRGGTKDLT